MEFFSSCADEPLVSLEQVSYFFQTLWYPVSNNFHTHRVSLSRSFIIFIFYVPSTLQVSLNMSLYSSLSLPLSLSPTLSLSPSLLIFLPLKIHGHPSMQRPPEKHHHHSPHQQVLHRRQLGITGENQRDQNGIQHRRTTSRGRLLKKGTHHFCTCNTQKHREEFLGVGTVHS